MTRMWLPVVCVLALGCTKDDVEDTGDSGEVISDFERFIDVEVEATGDLACYTAGDAWVTQSVDAAKQVDAAVSGKVIDFEEEVAVDEATVELWFADVVSGAADATATSTADGSVAFAAAPVCEPLTYRVTTDPLLGETKDTYEAHQIFPDGGTTTTEFNSVSSVTYTLIPSILGISVDTDKSIIAGTAYDCGEGPIEGAQVVVRDAAGDIPDSLVVKYFVENFPNYDQPHTSADGLWVAVNVPVGTWTVEMWAVVGGELALRGSTVVQSQADSINISNVYVGYGDGVKYPDGCLVDE